jgi:O-methyltransferase involved in polyketide biosynthesis
MREVAAREFDTEIPDVQDLWYAEERTDVGNWLSGHGWDATVTTAAELLSRVVSTPHLGGSDKSSRLVHHAQIMAAVGDGDFAQARSRQIRSWQISRPTSCRRSCRRWG